VRKQLALSHASNWSPGIAVGFPWLVSQWDQIATGTFPGINSNRETRD